MKKLAELRTVSTPSSIIDHSSPFAVRSPRRHPRRTYAIGYLAHGLYRHLEPRTRLRSSKTYQRRTRAHLEHQCLFQISQTRTNGTRVPLQDQLPKLGPPVDLGVSAGPRSLERTPMTTSIASFDAPAIPVTNKLTNPVTTPVTPSTLYVKEPGTRNVEEPVTTPVATSTTVDNPDDSLVLPRHPDPRVKLGYLGINDKPEEVKPPVVYGKIDGRIAHIMLDSGCSYPPTLRMLEIFNAFHVNPSLSNWPYEMRVSSP